jgi:glycosyltransferase involved in cell wall biosynthesis
MYCAEVNPPCPNSVIEAMACGLPVIGFDSGALKELVSDDAGCIVPYGANPWKLETPDISALAESAGQVLEKQNQFSPTGGGKEARRGGVRSRSNGRFLSQGSTRRLTATVVCCLSSIVTILELKSWIKKFTNFC